MSNIFLLKNTFSSHEAKGCGFIEEPVVAKENCIFSADGGCRSKLWYLYEPEMKGLHFFNPTSRVQSKKPENNPQKGQRRCPSPSRPFVFPFIVAFRLWSCTLLPRFAAFPALRGNWGDCK